jgi:hypothetical protein
VTRVDVDLRELCRQVVLVTIEAMPWLRPMVDTFPARLAVVYDVVCRWRDLDPQTREGFPDGVRGFTVRYMADVDRHLYPPGWEVDNDLLPESAVLRQVWQQHATQVLNELEGPR